MTTVVAIAVLAAGAASCSGDKAKNAASTGCRHPLARSASESFVGPKGFSPSCVKTKLNTQFVIGNVDDKAHSVSTSKDSPQAINVTLPHKNSVFSVKLTQAGTYRVTATGGSVLTIFVQ